MKLTVGGFQVGCSKSDAQQMHYYFGYAISSMVYNFFKANLVLESCDKCFKILSLYIISRLYPKINSKSLAEKFERGEL